MERDPHAAPGAGEEDLLGDPDEVDHSIEEELDDRLAAENEDEEQGRGN